MSRVSSWATPWLKLGSVTATRGGTLSGLVPGSPMSVEKGDDARPLLLKYSENGEEQELAFDLIVVLTKPKISLEQRALLKTLS
jgi:hypothetical protein